MKNIIIILIVLVGISVAGTRAYDIEPYRNCNGWTSPYPYNWVGQTFVAICDSLVWVDFFVGAPNDTGYNVEIYEYPMSGNPIYRGYAEGKKGYDYTKATIERVSPERIIKGKLYELKITYLRSDSINFYYDSTNSYQYGQISSGGGILYPPPQHPSRCDLAARVEGINRVDDDMFGCCVRLIERTFYGYGWAPVQSGLLANEAGITWDRAPVCWDRVNRDSTQRNTFYWNTVDSAFNIAIQNGIKILPVLLSTPLWARSKFFTPESAGHYPWPYDATWMYSPPINLYKPVKTPSGTIDTSNYFANFVHKIVRRYGRNFNDPANFWYNFNSQIREKFAPVYWEVWNEPNCLFHLRVPDSLYDSLYFNSMFRRCESTREIAIARCSVYVRMCAVADSAAYLADPQAKLLTTSLSTESHSLPCVDEYTFLRRYLEEGGGSFCDGISVHPYNWDTFDHNGFEIKLDSFAKIMREFDQSDKEIWVTEIGWGNGINNVSLEDQANFLLESYFTGISSATRVSGRYKNMAWFQFGDGAATDDKFGLVDTVLNPKFSYYAFKQMTENLKHKLFNCKVKNDTHPFYNYEFENTAGKKFWVAWKQAGEGNPLTIKFPVRTDMVKIESIQYSSNPNSHNLSANSDGYLSITVNETPVYITEPQSEQISRPDLMIDSLKIRPDTLFAFLTCTLKCWVKNIGQKQTPETTIVKFYKDGEYLGTATISTPITPCSTSVAMMTFFSWGPESTAINTETPTLLKAVVNESRTFMELEFDNNSKYKHTNLIRRYLQPDNQVKNWWWSDSSYIGNNIYNDTQYIYQYTSSNEPAIFLIKIENDGEAFDNIKVKANASTPPYQQEFPWIIHYFDSLVGGNNITDSISSSGWSTGSLGSNGYKVIRVEATPNDSIPTDANSKKIYITSYSRDTFKTDVVFMEAVRKNLQPDLLIKNMYTPYYVGGNVYDTTGAQSLTQKVWRDSAMHVIKIENDGQINDTIRLKGNCPCNDTWIITYYADTIGGNDITNSIVDSTYKTYVQIGQSSYIRIIVTPLIRQHNSMVECKVTATSCYNPRKKDVIKAITKIKNPRYIEDPVVADRATGPNQGRHLDRVVNTENLKRIHEGDEAIFYTSSEDNGDSWFEEAQGDGWFPCIGISHEGLPWIAYAKDGDLICKIRRPDSSYKEILIFDGNENLWAGPPSMALATMPIKEDVKDYAYITYPVYECSIPENPMPQPPENISHSYIYVTIFDTADKVTYLIDEAEAEVRVSHPCVAVTPADLIHIVWQKEDEIWYITNSEKITPENWEYVEWTEKYCLSQTELISEHPFVESYGDMVYVVWKEGEIGEIIQKQRDVWKPSEYENWSEPENISNSAEMNSDYPQMSTSEVIVWQEADAENNYKVYAKIYNDNICLTLDANDIRFVNCNALIIDPKEPEIEVYYCYTDEITENELYQVKFEKYLYDSDMPDEEIEYYEGKVGVETTSPYCELRSGYIDYGNYKIDYGNQLKYKLKYLNPYKKYMFQGILYQCTTGMIHQRLDVEDTLTSTDTICPAIPETINFFIRPNSYKENLASRIKIHKTQGAYSVLADFKLYEYETINDSGSGGSGQQSAGLEHLPIPTVLQMPKPNPFTNQTQIRFQIPVKTKIDLKIYNSVGRLVNTLISDEMNPGYYTMTWSSKDEQERTQPNGIYFIRLKTKDYDMTKKMVMVK